MKRTSRWMPWAGLVAMLIFGIAAYRILRTPRIEVEPGAMVRFDDFDFTAVAAREIRPGDYEVEVSVRNQARVVDFDYVSSVVRASSETGVDLAAEGPRLAAHLHPTESFDSTPRFRGPAGLRELWVRFDFGGGFLSYVDRVTLGNRQIRLLVAR